MIAILMDGRVADGADFVPEHARVAPFMAAGVYQLPLLALIEGHLAARTQRSASFVFQNFTDRRQIKSITADDVVASFANTRSHSDSAVAGSSTYFSEHCTHFKT